MKKFLVLITKKILLPILEDLPEFRAAVQKEVDLEKLSIHNRAYNLGYQMGSNSPLTPIEYLKEFDIFTYKPESCYNTTATVSDKLVKL